MEIAVSEKGSLIVKPLQLLDGKKASGVQRFGCASRKRKAPHNQSAEKGGPTWPARLAELIKLIVQVLDDVLRFSRGEFFFCHMTAATQLLFQLIQRPNESVLAGIDASIVASHAVSVMQALPVGAVARQFGVSARWHQQDQ